MGDPKLLSGVLFGALGVSACIVEIDQTPLTGGSTGSESGEAGTDDGPPESEPAPARGISILEVEINQGTRVPIGFGGDWVDGPDRLGYLIASRDTLMRIHYEVDEGWVPREIEARLWLDFPDGTQKYFVDRRMVEHSSSAKNFNGPFRFGLIADDGQTVAGTTYRIELWDPQPELAGEAAEGVWANPAGGSQLIGFEAIPMQIRTLLVPITYNGTTAGLDEDTTTTLLDNLYEQNPTTEILYDVREPIPYDNQLVDLGVLLPIMAGLRNQDGADPNVYYHALVDVDSQSLGGLLGISYLANDTKGDANSRVSATVLWAPNPSIAADTYTHETGHAQGLNHVECPNRDAATPDPNYPHANGRIGNWGFGIRRFLMYDPDDAYDYMTYCSPTWVSDWTWNKIYRRIKTLTSWDFEAPGAGEPMQTLLVGALYADGSQQWWTMPGTIDPERVSGLDRFEFELAGDGVVVESWADVSVLSDDRTHWVKTALPAELADIAEIRHVRGSGAAQQVDLLMPADVGLDIDLGQAAAREWQPNWKVYKPR